MLLSFLIENNSAYISKAWIHHLTYLQTNSVGQVGQIIILIL